jgi:hypothetical protein
MANNLIGRIVRFVKSPQGQRLISKAQQEASKPENRRKLDQLRQRVMRRKG